MFLVAALSNKPSISRFRTVCPKLSIILKQAAINFCDNLATVGVEFRSWQHKAVTVCYMYHDCIGLVGAIL